MSRRIDIELTSTRPDGSWTWRAAGAKQPKGDVDGSMLPSGSKVGDVLKVDIEKYLDGMSVVAVLPSQRQRTEPTFIEVVGTRRNEELVTSTLVEKRGRRDGDRGDRGDRGPRGPRSDRPGGDRGGPRGDRPARPGGDRGPRPDRPARPEGGARPDRPPRTEGGARPERRGPRPEGGSRPDGGARPERARRERPAAPPVPKPMRLRPGRVHRVAVLAELPEEQKPIAEQLLRGGIPGVRQAIEKQNEAARAEGQPEVRADSLLAFAEQLLPRLRAAEWRDKADAALAGIDEIDLRDLRTVVVAADAAGRDDEARDVAQKLRDGLSARVDGEHAKWLAELTELVGDGRTVRALRLSSRPPKAGAPLPGDLSERLAAAASAGLTADITQDRWATLVDAVAFSPVRLAVRPLGVPTTVGDELKATIARIGSRVPHIAELFGVTPEAAAPRRGPGGPGGRTRRTTGAAFGAPSRGASARPAASSSTDAPTADAPTADAPTPDAPTPDAPTPDASTTDAPAEPTTAASMVPDSIDDAAGESSGSASDDGAQDAVVVQELGEPVDEG